MSDPKTFREVNFVLDGLERRVALLTKIGGGIAALLVAIFGFLGNLYSVIGKVQIDVAATKATVDGLNTRLTSIDADVKAIRTDQGQILSRVQPPPTPPPPQPTPRVQDLIAGGFYVTEPEATLIRVFLKVPPKQTDVAPK